METSIHNRILVISLTFAIVSIAGVISGILLKYPAATVFPLLFGFSVLAVISSYAIKFQNKNRIVKSTKYSIFLLPVFVVITSFIPYENLLLYVMVIGSVLLAIAALIYLFIYIDAKSLTGVIVLLILIVAGIFLKRNHIFYAGITLSVSTFLISAGSFIFGIRCLCLAEKNTYFRNMTFFGSCALSVAFLGQLFKLQHWIGAGVLISVGFTSLILGTLYILITLHSSGYIDWQPFYKRIFLKILIPWVFIFILYISRFMVPELNTLIWSPNPRKIEKVISPYGFGMKDYSIEDKLK
jgi:hypothetical protein